MNDDFPTAVPDAIPAAVEPVPENVILTATARQHLCQTGPWIRFFSILMLIGSGFVMLIGILMVLMGFFGGFASQGPLPGVGPMPGGMGIVFMGPVYFLMALLVYILPAIFLFRYSGAIRTLRSSPSPLALEDAMKHQKTFWRYVGIMTSILIALSLLIGIVAGFLAAFMASRSI